MMNKLTWTFGASLVGFMFCSVLFSCKAPEKNETPRKFVIEKDCSIKREEWEPFSYVLTTDDGMRIPLAGDFAPLEESPEDCIRLKGAQFTLEIASYDLSAFHESRRKAIERNTEVLGKEMPISGVDGIPGDSSNSECDYVLVTEIVIDGKVIALAGALERFGVTKKLYGN